MQNELPGTLQSWRGDTIWEFLGTHCFLPQPWGGCGLVSAKLISRTKIMSINILLGIFVGVLSSGMEVSAQCKRAEVEQEIGFFSCSNRSSPESPHKEKRTWENYGNICCIYSCLQCICTLSLNIRILG